MATKDWKKIEDSNSAIIFKNKLRQLIIIEKPKYYNRKYYILFKPNSDSELFFKTKTEAMRFAKAYMRKH